MEPGCAEQAWPTISWMESAQESRERAKPCMAEPRAHAAATDEALMTWSAAGDRRAFDEIVTRHGPFALRVACRLTRERLAAEDVVQEAMVRAWSKARQFDARRARLQTWLHRIVVNLCIDHMRRARTESLPEGFDIVDPATGAEDAMMVRERHTALADAVTRLPARQRAALTLVYDEGLSGAETAQLLGVSPKAVERLLARARADLRTQLAPHHMWQGT